MKPLTAYHVGRRGEVAGGMTQVVNAYLNWTFERFETEVIVSRDGSTGVRGALIAVRAALSIIRLPRHRSVVVVHLSNDGSFVREGGLLVFASLIGLPVVAHLHGSRFPAYARERPGIVRRVLRRADRVLVLSAETEAVAETVVSSDLVELVPNAVDAPSSEREKEHLVVFGGAVSRRKGVDVLLSAWEQLRASGGAREWRLLIAGPVVDEEIVRPVPGVELLGSLDHAALMETLERSSVAVLPSRDEALPMFILEAMARSNALVSTPVGGIAAVLGDGVGELVPVGDAARLAEVLHNLTSDPAVLEPARARARSAYERSYSAVSVYPRIEAAWGAAVAHRRGATRGAS